MRPLYPLLIVSTSAALVLTLAASRRNNETVFTDFSSAITTTSPSYDALPICIGVEMPELVKIEIVLRPEDIAQMVSDRLGGVPVDPPYMFTDVVMIAHVERRDRSPTEQHFEVIDAGVRVPHRSVTRLEVQGS